MRRGVGPVGAARQHRDGRARRGQRCAVRGGVDPVGRAAHDREPAHRQPVGEVGRDAQAVLGRGPRPHDGDAALDQGPEVGVSTHEQAVRRLTQAVEPDRPLGVAGHEHAHPVVARRPSHAVEVELGQPHVPAVARRQLPGPQPRQGLHRPALPQQPGHAGVARLREEGPRSPGPALVELQPAGRSRRAAAPGRPAHAATSSPLRRASPVATSSRPGTSSPARSAADHATRSTRS